MFLFLFLLFVKNSLHQCSDNICVVLVVSGEVAGCLVMNLKRKCGFEINETINYVTDNCLIIELLALLSTCF